MRSWRRKAIWGSGLAGTVLVIVAVVTVIAAARPHSHAGASDTSDAEPAEADAKAVAVKTIRPKRDSSFSLSVKQPATVAPYYHSELDAQVAGRVEFIRKAAGSPVKAGELLVKIAVPDLEQEVLLKDAVVQQRRRDLELAEKSIKVAAAAVAVAKSNIPVKEAKVDAADAMRI